MSTAQELERALGRDVYDVNGQKVGTAASLYASDLSGEPEWVTVKTGLFGTKESFVPLTGAHTEQDGLHVGARKDAIKDAPREILERLLVNGYDADPLYLPMTLHIRDTSEPPPR
jgi:PRC-barrel domain protein